MEKLYISKDPTKTKFEENVELHEDCDKINLFLKCPSRLYNNEE